MGLPYAFVRRSVGVWVVPMLFLGLAPAALAQRNLTVAPADAAEVRVALVIGNSSYKTYPLKNPVNDATDIAKMLNDLGWKVTLKIDANQRQMKDEIRDFGNSLARGGVGLFYYAGRGVEYRGQNYLVPLGANIEREVHIEDETVSARFVLVQMEEARNRTNIIILDACRDNPFARSFRSVSRGLAEMKAPQGTLIAFAAAPGEKAADGEGRNGVYTKHLLRQIVQPGVPAEVMFRRVREGVLDETKEQQTPWENSSLRGADFFFRPGPAFATAAPSVTAVPSVDPKEQVLWDSVKNSTNSADFDAYLSRYPDGQFAARARDAKDTFIRHEEVAKKLAAEKAQLEEQRRKMKEQELRMQTEAQARERELAQRLKDPEKQRSTIFVPPTF